MIALIDNYDSFTYNVYDYVSRAAEVMVFRNTESLDRMKACSIEGIVISPGPSHPAQSLLSLDAIDYYKERVPILGICLGMQAMGHYFGTQVRRAATIMHGKVDRIEHYGGALFAGIQSGFSAVRYHSLVIDCDGGPLGVTARSRSDGEVMAVQHATLPLFGLQFHPESYLTADGMTFIRNFLTICDGRR
jgi:anthranilate synthase/aminodeoxychorismate synthase-like glutamine amidotransferase